MGKLTTILIIAIIALVIWIKYYHGLDIVHPSDVTTLVNNTITGGSQ